MHVKRSALGLLGGLLLAANGCSNSNTNGAAGIDAADAFVGSGDVNNDAPAIDALDAAPGDAADAAGDAAGDAGVGDAATSDAGDAAVTTALVRLIHLAPNAPAVDVFADGSSQAMAANIGFEQSTAFVPLPPGTHAFHVSLAAVPGVNVYTLDGVPLQADHAYTAIAYGRVGNATTPLLAQANEDDLSPVAGNNIRLRVLHMAAGIGPLNLLSAGANAVPGASDLGYGKTTAFVTLAPGSHTVTLDTNRDGTADYSFALPSLPTGSISNVFVVQPSTTGAPSIVLQREDSSVTVINPS